MKEEYYYSNLSLQEKKYYEKILAAIQRREMKITLGGILDTSTVSKIWEALRYDQPKLFYLGEIQISYLCSVIGITCLIDYAVSATMQNTIMKRINQKLEQMLAQIGIEKTDKDVVRCRKIHNYLCNNVTYDYQAYNDSHKQYPEAYNILGPLEKGKGVCSGISKLFKALCDRTDLECFIIHGNSLNKESPGPHAWNIVKIEGQWTQMDVTWDICNSSNHTKYKYDYFCLSDKYMKADHAYKDYPLCQTDDFSYFAQTNRLFPNVKSLKQYLERELSRHAEILYFKITSDSGLPADIEEKINNLVGKQIKQYHHTGYSWIRYTNQQHNIFYYQITYL